MHQIIQLVLRVSLLGAIAALFAGCATAPSPLAGDYPDFYPDQATERSVDARIRWGGTIVDTRPGEAETCVEILSRELGRDHRPQTGGPVHGRFLACRDGFQDPAVFASGNNITVVGRLTGFVTGQIGEFEYTYPRVDADVLYLWAQQPQVTHYYADPWWYDPWWPHYRYRYPYSRFSGHVIIRR